MGDYRVLGDWGTSRLRLFRIEDWRVVDRAAGPGIGALDEPAEQALRRALASWRQDGDPASIRLSGMVGSRNGWVEVPYLDCPADAATWRAAAHHLALDGVPAAIMPGLATADDVMRGEEAQIFGALSAQPALAAGVHTLVLPGTHSKWVRLAEGGVASFRSFFTGEMFALLRSHSTLARVGADGGGEESAGFDDGIARARAGGVLGGLFRARALQLRQGCSRAWALGYLSGLLIGGEIAEAIVDFPGAVTLIGDPALCARYARALAIFGVGAQRLDGEACALAGLRLAEDGA